MSSRLEARAKCRVQATGEAQKRYKESMELASWNCITAMLMLEAPGQVHRAVPPGDTVHT